MKRKIFGIGFHKTGTKSLAKALRQLGFSVTGPNGVHDPDIATNVHAVAHDLIQRYDAFQDNPWPIIYPWLDRQCPGSKFILTVRDTDSWIKSQVGHFGRAETPMRKWIYGVGCPKGNEAIYIRRYETHNREVREYFASRPGDLLVMDFAKGDGWQPLCTFLGRKLPNAPFPHMNRAQDRTTGKNLFSRLFGKR